MTGAANQVGLQLPIAVALSIGSFLLWVLLLRIVGWRKWCVLGAGEYGASLLGSVLWGVLVFVPLHYFTQGYVTSPGNLVALALYQLPVNALALLGCPGEAQNS